MKTKEGDQVAAFRDGKWAWLGRVDLLIWDGIEWYGFIPDPTHMYFETNLGRIRWV